jgi:hypothetical protein
MPCPAVAAEPKLYVLIVGDSVDAEMLRFALTPSIAVATVQQFPHFHSAWPQFRSGRVNTLVVDMQTAEADLDGSIMSVFRVREDYPEIVVALLANGHEFESVAAKLVPETRNRLRHYFRIDRSLTTKEVELLIERSQRWHRAEIDKRPYTKNYEYDVALSFAGEDRPYAEELATVLNAHGVRVFYDTFEQADLWGKNLFEHLFAIYSERSRYCIMFISASYSEKMWTVHERRAAQDRVLKERDTEYLLPIRIDNTRLPGLPDSVAYLPISLGIRHIATLFLRKLGAAVGKIA